MASSSLHKNVIDDDGTPSPSSSSPPPPLARTQSLPPAKDGLPQVRKEGVAILVGVWHVFALFV